MLDKAIEIINENTTGVTNNQTPFLTDFRLAQNYPNPFNPLTRIEFELLKPGKVKINVYDIRGRLTTNLLNEHKMSGKYSVDFDASNMASGVYYYRVETVSFVCAKKMLLIK